MTSFMMFFLQLVSSFVTAGVVGSKAHRFQNGPLKSRVSGNGEGEARQGPTETGTVGREFVGEINTNLHLRNIYT